MKDGLKGKKIGIARETYFDELNESQLTVMNNAINKLKELGVEVVDPITIPSTNEEWDINVLLYEFKTDLNAYLKTIDSTVGVRTLTDVIKANEEIGEKALKFGQKLFLDANATSGNLIEPEYLESLEKDDTLSKTKGIDSVMQEQGLDAIVFPNNFGAMIPAKAGYPSITVPAGYTNEGEPVGITFTAKAYMEPTLLEIAYSYEQATKHRVAPFQAK